MQRQLIVALALVAALVGCSGTTSPSPTVTTTETATATVTATATATATATPSNKRPAPGITVRVRVTAEGTPVRVVYVNEGWVGQLYSPQERSFDNHAFSYYTWVSWGDGTPRSGGDSGNVECRAGGALVPIFELGETEHEYSAPGRYTITVGTGYCLPTGGHREVTATTRVKLP